jgi:predicted dehydrogenase
MNKFRWGILGTAQIARKNWKAVLNTGNSVVAAVASRNVERSRRFIAECQRQVPFDAVPAALGSYEELLASRNVDAVYIPLPTGLRKEWVVRAAEAGKHVLCEKPCGVNVADVREMVEACRRNRVQFMDGVMFMHSSRLEQIRAVLDDGVSVGEVKRITTAFSFLAPEDFARSDIRMDSRLEPFGCLGDLGWYCIRFALWVMNGQLPRQVAGRVLAQQGTPHSPLPVPTAFSAELVFDGRASAGFYCSFLAENQQWANVSGDRGYLQVPDFVLPFNGSEIAFEVHNATFDTSRCDFIMEPHPRRFTVAEHSHGHPDAQETNMFRNFANQVSSGHLNDAWPETALKTQQVINACFDSARAEGRLVSVR